MRTALIVFAACLLSACSSRSGGVVVEPQAGIVGGGTADSGSNRVWVCHRGRWQDVAAPAADAHRRHGDRVSTAPRQSRAQC